MARAPSGLAAADLAGLALFVDAVDLGSLSAAARHHRISQPSASEAVRRLERRLGFALLVRTPRGSRPTPEGETIAARVRGLLADLAGLDAEVVALRAAARRQVRVAASYTNAEYVLPARIARFRLIAPDIAVRLVVVNSHEVLSQVEAGTADVGFVEVPREWLRSRGTGLRSRAVGTDALVVVVAPRHPWAGRELPLPAAELAGTALLLRERESGTRAAYEAAVVRAGLQVADPLGVMTSTEALKAAVRAGLGASVVSGLTLADELAAGTLCAVPVDGLDLRRELRAVWLAGRRNPLADALLATLTDAPGGTASD